MSDRLRPGPWPPDRESRCVDPCRLTPEDRSAVRPPVPHDGRAGSEVGRIRAPINIENCSAGADNSQRLDAARARRTDSGLRALRQGGVHLRTHRGRHAAHGMTRLTLRRPPARNSTAHSSSAGKGGRISRTCPHRPQADRLVHGHGPSANQGSWDGRPGGRRDRPARVGGDCARGAGAGVPAANRAGGAAGCAATEAAGRHRTRPRWSAARRRDRRRRRDTPPRAESPDRDHRGGRPLRADAGRQVRGLHIRRRP